MNADSVYFELNHIGDMTIRNIVGISQIYGRDIEVYSMKGGVVPI
jgi:hypothetical protein